MNYIWAALITIFIFVGVALLWVISMIAMPFIVFWGALVSVTAFRKYESEDYTYEDEEPELENWKHDIPH